MSDLSTLQTTTQELWTLTNENSTRYRTVEWSPCRLDWSMDDSATPFQKSQSLCDTRCEATTSNPRVNYDWSEYSLTWVDWCSWLCHYPRPLICLHDKRTKFTGIEFQELLQSYGIKAVVVTTANPQTNAILERTHQVIVNQLRSLRLMSIELNSLADI